MKILKYYLHTAVMENVQREWKLNVNLGKLDIGFKNSNGIQQYCIW